MLGSRVFFFFFFFFFSMTGAVNIRFQTIVRTASNEEFECK